MKIIISGYGRMGHEIERAASERNHLIVATPDNVRDWDFINLQSSGCDVVIDFSTPASAALVVNRCLNSGMPVVSGTTGWPEELEKSKELCRKLNGSFFYSPNFSIGVNIFFEINRNLAKIMSDKEYSVMMNEIHHIHKLDAPSGTAIALANDIISENKRFKSWSKNSDDQLSVIPIISERTGEVPGTHYLQWISDADTIELKHTAHNRTGFAKGAVMAAEWIYGKSGIFGMSDMLFPGK